jgi:2-polyprenyl-6-methoxyphenol hydroxylase-like FAD-dependent oxidoreductase
LAAAEEADDFYFDSLAQIHMPSWSSGRVTLVGDAGYCASPLSGMGTSLALVGSYVLAGELGPANSFDAQSLSATLIRYATVMRPYVDKCQDLPNSLNRFAPKTESDIASTAMVMKWMQRWPFRPIAAKLWFTKADSIELPDYSFGAPRH